MKSSVSSSSLNTSNEIATTQNQNSNEENTKLASVADPKAEHSLRCSCFKSKDKITETNRNNNTNSNDGPTPSNPGHNEAEALSNWIGADLGFIRKASETIKRYEDQINKVSVQFEELKNNGSRDDLRELKKIVTKLKQQISSRNKDESEDADPQRDTRSNFSGGNANKSLEETPNLYKSTTFEQSSAFKDLQARYDDLGSTELKLCLLSFSVFPENVTITKRLMIYWWIGEGFVCSSSDRTAEKLASEFFNELMAKGFIEPVNEKRSLAVDRCRMHPFIRSGVIMLAERAKFFDFDSAGNLTEDFSCSLRACLVGKGLSNIQDLEKLHMVFNVNEPILEFKPEWFLKMRNVNVLYLGRWQTSATHHIEVEDTKFLDGLKNMNHLRFFSLQGVSRITELPDSISQLTNLMILDLRACHNLEVLPNGIGCLKSLTHFDMSECYLLDHMPKGLASLSELVVLNGFVVSRGKNSCTLDDLATLGKLRKLSIYTGVKDFPTDTDLQALHRFQKLLKLTIAWGRGSQQNEPDKNANQATDATKSTSLDTPEQAKDAAKSTVQDTVEQEKDTAKSTVQDTAEQANDEAKSTAGETAKQVKDAAKSTAPDTTKQAEDATKSTASEITNSENKGSSPAKTDNDAKQENSARNPKGENIGDDKKKGNSGAKPGRLASMKSSLTQTLKTKSAATINSPGLPSQLEKLDLQCFPEKITPSWLKPRKLNSLKKLYIRGGKFSDLGPFEEFDDKGGKLPEVKWEVEELRLKYLSELKMDWTELQKLFPKLIYLEKHFSQLDQLIT
ncbi:hypothetical protein F0562_018995 [Nyssa sinensis]|uniref:Uncharacterized protein n=1 Tax=Nyssa sinensis TaxID=561372 RepID=A0A5J4ZCB4_9ASTE|nr:hypothetical protein F0562_018995 [Nyssa sinensis]